MEGILFDPIANFRNLAEKPLRLAGEKAGDLVLKLPEKDRMPFIIRIQEISKEVEGRIDAVYGDIKRTGGKRKRKK
jgi:hypothetical protein